jgi:ATP-dependent helicase/nuclease subunit A
MTRARDRLYIAGFEGRRGRTPGCWYEHIVEGLSGDLEQVQDALGVPVKRRVETQAVAATARAQDQQGDGDLSGGRPLLLSGQGRLRLC